MLGEGWDRGDGELIGLRCFMEEEDEEEDEDGLWLFRRCGLMNTGR